jgi:CCR4-NOT transcription complex subunit 2
MVKQPTSEQTEFQMSSEDFPALPGTDGGSAGVVGSQTSNSVNQQAITSSAGVVSSVSSVIASGGLGGNQLTDGVLGNSMVMMENKNTICMDMMQSNDTGATSAAMGGSQQQQSGGKKSGVQTSPNGLVTNIPASMVNNQFGMVGLLTFIRAAESDPNLVSLAMGQDLTALGLNLNSMDNLYQSFGGPFSDSPAR